MDDRPSRRTALKALGATVGVGAVAGALSPLAGFASGLSAEELLQRHYRELSAEDLARILARLEAETRERYGAEVTIRDDRPTEATSFGYALNLTACIGCRRCAEACLRENNHDRSTRGSHTRLFEMEQGSMDLERARVDYRHEVPAPGRFYMPVQCMQCRSAPCVRACPTHATWQEPDGIVVVDYGWCIGCRYCMAACPYQGRRFNWRRPELAADEVNADQGYLSNRIRPQGVVEKCTFCLHRVRRGLLPACAEACPTGSRVFGNLLDASSEVRFVLDEKRIFVLRESLGTSPRLFYYFEV